jgi:hypothetical protein
MESDASEQALSPAGGHRPQSSRHGSSKHVHADAPSHRHSKPWTARLYRKHDAKHHQVEPEAAPLLAESEPEEPAPGGDEPRPGYNFRRRARELFESGANSGVNGAKAITKKIKEAGAPVKNNPKRSMAGAIILLTITSLGLGSKLLYDHNKPVDQSPELCATPDCVAASNYILNNLDPSVLEQAVSQEVNVLTTPIDPCTDFDQYVCGGFQKSQDIRGDKGYISTSKCTFHAFSTSLTSSRKPTCRRQ